METGHDGVENGSHLSRKQFTGGENGSWEAKIVHITPRMGKRRRKGQCQAKPRVKMAKSVRKRVRGTKRAKTGQNGQKRGENRQQDPIPPWHSAGPKGLAHEKSKVWSIRGHNDSHATPFSKTQFLTKNVGKHHITCISCGLSKRCGFVWKNSQNF